ncbi:hypothetical protein L9F63_026032, partial [Diploptera punctata]
RFDFLHPSRFQQSFSPLPHSRRLQCYVKLTSCLYCSLNKNKKTRKPFYSVAAALTLLAIVLAPAGNVF